MSTHEQSLSFSFGPTLETLRKEVRTFVDEKILPVEKVIEAEDARGDRTTLNALRFEAKAAGLYVPHLPKEYGGLGLGVLGMCALFREMGRSLVAAPVFNCEAPDQGNMDLLLAHATAAQREQYLAPLARGDVTSTFCMTEPAPGAGADPSNLMTVAKAGGNGDYVLDGRKWYSTGGRDAAFMIVMARTSDDPKNGASMFLVDRHAAGVEHVREIGTMMEPLLVHRESEFRFHGVKLPKSAVLGEIGQGFSLAQSRLVPARLTHCMRWLGLSARALDLCKEYASTRISFGKPLASHQLILKKFADNAAAIHTGNLLTLHCASMLAQGLTREAKPYSSMAKNHVARAFCQVLDDAIQIHGGLGYSTDMPFANWYRAARSARIADGPDEVHDIVVGRDYLKGLLPVLV
jgi:acyl-CoA dehydrogenase